MFENSLPIIKRLWYKSTKTGILENDILLSSFARSNLINLSSQELTIYERLLYENDWNIFHWAMKQKTPPEFYGETSLMRKLQEHAEILKGR